jgi:hypothetical protein
MSDFFDYLHKRPAEQKGLPMLTEKVDIDALCAHAESLCRRIAPLDLGDVPLYIVPQSRLPVGRFGKSQCDGYTTGSLDLYCQRTIGSAWRGRGACMVINDADVAGMEPLDAELFFDVIAVHELAHILERSALYHDRAKVAPRQLRQEAAGIARLVAADAPDAEKIVPFLGHGARFIRAALHLCHRAQAVGAWIAASRVFYGARYGLSHAAAYRKALGTEPRRLANVRMHDILRSPAPKAFSRLWTADVVHWFTICPPYGERLFA